MLLGQSLLAESVKIFAAASTYPALKTLKQKLKQEQGIDLIINSAASSTLARQIMNGAECDIVLLANNLWMNKLEERNLIIKSSRQNYLSNKLVLITQRQNKNPINLQTAHKVAMGDPTHVPVGQYANRYFEAKQIWAKIKYKILPANNTRTALLWVEQGLAPLGVVYKSDAKLSSKVRIIKELDSSPYFEISYPIAQCASKNPKLFDLPISKSNKKTFEKQGFTTN